MTINQKDIIELEGKKYIVIVAFSEEGTNYAFVNELEDDENDVTEDYYLIKVTDKLEIITDEKLLNKLFPKIEELVKKELKEV